MQSLFRFFEEGVLTLRRASGISTSLTKAAEDLAQSAANNDILMQVRTIVPSSQEDGLYLKKLGVQLFNVIKNGSSADMSILHLRLLACFCMVGSGGSGAGDDKVDLRDLDAMRCFSSTAKSLIELGKREIGREALRMVIHLAGERPLEKIRGCFGETQEAHDFGYALFVALCSLCQLTIKAVQNKDANAQEHFNEMMLLLQSYSVYLSAIERAGQLKLRNIIEDGIQNLDLPNSILLQQYLCDEWESFISSTTEYNISVASYLACSLSEAGDLSGALAALERAETLAIILHPLGSKLARSHVEVSVARCAVSVLKLKDEFKIYNLVTHATAPEDPSDLTSVQVRRYSDARQECISKFQELAKLVKNASESNAVHNRLWDCLLSLVSRVYSATQAFEASYLTILELSLKNLDRIANIILRMLDHNASDVAEWLGMPKVKAAMECMARSKENRTVIKVAWGLWNVSCDLRGKRRWREMENILQLVDSLVEQDSALKLRAKLGHVFACMHTKLPDKDGNQENEMQVLRSCTKSLQEVLERSTDLQLSKLAALLELFCTIRLASIDSTVTKEKVLKTLQEYSNFGYFDCRALLALADEAHVLRANELKMDILHLILRIGIEEDAHDVKQSIQEARQKVVRLLLKQQKLSKIEEDIIQWLEQDKGRLDEACILDMKSRRKLVAVLHQQTESISKEPTIATAPQMLDQALLAYMCGRLSSDTDTAQKYLKYTAAQSVHTGIILSLKGRDNAGLSTENLSLVVQCGERAAKALLNIPDDCKRQDKRLGICAVFSTIFMAAGIAEADGIVADRLAVICDAGEYAPPAPEALISASKFARHMGMKTSSMRLLLKAAELALQEKSEDKFDAIVHKSLHDLIKAFDDISVAIDWVDRIHALVQSNKMNPMIIHSLAIALWNHLVSLKADKVELYQHSLFWLELACRQDVEIRENRTRVLDRMKVHVTNLNEPKSENQNSIEVPVKEAEEENVLATSMPVTTVIPIPDVADKATTSMDFQVATPCRASTNAGGLEEEQMSTEDEVSDENNGIN